MVQKYSVMHRKKTTQESLCFPLNGEFKNYFYMGKILAYNFFVQDY